MGKRLVILGTLIMTFWISVSGKAWAAPTIQFLGFVFPPVWDIALPVQVSIISYSPVALAKVEAAIGTNEISLQPTMNDPNRWEGSLPLADPRPGPTTLVVTATDANGATESLRQEFILDGRPRMFVEPLVGAVAHPTLHINIRCEDDDQYGCESVALKRYVYVFRADSQYDPLLSGVTAIDQDVSLAQYEGTKITLQASVRDTADLGQQERFDVYVDSSSRLQENVSVQGDILDADATRILHYARGTTSIFDIATKAYTAIAQGPIYDGFLTRFGVFWSGGQWENGTYTHSLLRSGLRVAGDYAVWSNHDKGTDGQWYRNLQTGSETRVSNSIGSDNGIDVAANGVAFYESNLHVFRYKDGVSEDMGPLSTPRTDGTIVVGRVKSQFSECGDIWMVDANGARTQLTQSGVCRPTGGGVSWAANNGWVAYGEKIDGHAVVFTRSPTGTVAQRSGGQGDSWIEALGADGSLTMISDGRRYWSGGNSPPIHISSALGTAKQIGTDWFVMMGRTLFRVDTAEAKDGSGGCNAGGSIVNFHTLLSVLLVTFLGRRFRRN